MKRDVVYVGLIVDVVGGSSKRSCFVSRRIPVVIKVEGDDDIVDPPIQHRIYISQVCTCSKLAVSRNDRYRN
jgi:hypothetical protein